MAIQAAIQSGGHMVDIGPPHTEFTGTSLPNYDAVVLVPSPHRRIGRGDMPVAGQTALNYFVSVAGGGLVTGEPTVWSDALEGNFSILNDSLPVLRTGSYICCNPGQVTYTQVTPDDMLDAGVDPSFTFNPDSFDVADGEVSDNPLLPKDGATIFYNTDTVEGRAWVVGWAIGPGGVISISTPMGPMALADPNYSQLLANAVTWTVTRN
jgi:hypothetical protein